MENTLYYGDNLEILRNKIKDNSIDLCYIDPPFNSKRTYFQIYNNLGVEDKAQAQAFTDTWQWDTEANEGYQQIITNFEGRFTRQSIELIRGLEIILGQDSLLAYLVSMTLRITEIFRVLKPTGSFYLHCDPTASHYLKLMLDAVFCGQGGDYLNEIVWCYGSGGASKRHFSKKHDVIFFYAKSEDYVFNVDAVREEYSSPWKSMTPKIVGDKEYVKMNPLGRIPFDWWQIPILTNSAKERLGYPTQKPEALLEKIISASSNEGDVVLDAYCGCGTTVAVAERLKRNWIGIDITYHSISLILKRMEDTFGKSIIQSITVDGIPKDLAAAVALANRPDDRVRKEFEKWAVLTYTNNRAVINAKKGADKGIDGVVYFTTSNSALTTTSTERMIIQVKSGGANRATIATLHSDMVREKAEMATLISMDEPTKPMREEAAKVGKYYHELMGRSYDRIQIVTVRELIEQEKRLDLPMSFVTTKTARKDDGSEGQMQIPL